jgi:hypothetical protein
MSERATVCRTQRSLCGPRNRHGRLHRLAKAHAATRADNVDASLLGDHLTLLFEGVYASVQALGARGPAKRARQAVASLLDAG